MDLTIHKSKCASGKYSQRGLRNGEVAKNKRQAALDITKCCREGFFTRNYLGVEYLVMQLHDYEYEFIPMDYFLNLEAEA